MDDTASLQRRLGKTHVPAEQQTKRTTQERSEIKIKICCKTTVALTLDFAPEYLLLLKSAIEKQCK